MMMETPTERIQNALGVIREHRHEPPTQIIVSPKFTEELCKEVNDKIEYNEKGINLQSIQNILGLTVLTRLITEDFIIV